MGNLCKKSEVVINNDVKYSRIEINSSETKIHNLIDKFVHNVARVYKYKLKNNYNKMQYNSNISMDVCDVLDITFNNKSYMISYKICSNPYYNHLMNVYFSCNQLNLDIVIELHFNEKSTYFTDTNIKYRLIFCNNSQSKLYTSSQKIYYNVHDELCFINYFLKCNTSSLIEKAENSKFNYISNEYNTVNTHNENNICCVTRHIMNKKQLLKISNIIHILMDIIPEL